MKQYTEQELDEKIHTFITSKMDQFPELAAVKQRDMKQTSQASEKTNVLGGIFSSQLELSFK